MLLKDLREHVKKYKENDLREIIAEMYKMMPKKLREDKNVDSLIGDLKLFKDKASAPKKEIIDVYDLKDDIDLFIEYAYEQYYFAPNRYVPKKDRPKWRFIVKRFINDLQKVPSGDEDGDLATELLINIYKMLNYACNYYLFNTEDPYVSVGIGQSELLNIIFKRIFAGGLTDSNIHKALGVAILPGSARDFLSESKGDILISHLVTPDSRTMAIEQVKLIRDGTLDKIKTKDVSSYSSFELSETKNYLTLIVTKLYLLLSQYEDGIRYFWNNFKKNSPEIALYVLLEVFMSYGSAATWRLAYEDGLRRKINPREGLKVQYEHILLTGDFEDWDY